jgi:hypothetical protein
MNVELHLKPIEKIKAEALLMPVDGDVCLLGSSAMKGLKNSLKQHYGLDEWMEMLEYLEQDVRKLESRRTRWVCKEFCVNGFVFIFNKPAFCRRTR